MHSEAQRDETTRQLSAYAAHNCTIKLQTRRVDTGAPFAFNHFTIAITAATLRFAFMLLVREVIECARVLERNALLSLAPRPAAAV